MVSETADLLLDPLLLGCLFLHIPPRPRSNLRVSIRLLRELISQLEGVRGHHLYHGHNDELALDQEAIHNAK